MKKIQKLEKKKKNVSYTSMTMMANLVTDAKAQPVMTVLTTLLSVRLQSRNTPMMSKTALLNMATLHLSSLSVLVPKVLTLLP